MSEKEPPEQRPDETGKIDEGAGYTRNSESDNLFKAAVRGS